MLYGRRHNTDNFSSKFMSYTTKLLSTLNTIPKNDGHCVFTKKLAELQCLRRFSGFDDGQFYITLRDPVERPIYIDHLRSISVGALR